LKKSKIAQLDKVLGNWATALLYEGPGTGPMKIERAELFCD
jgi:hypothetical protein